MKDNESLWAFACSLYHKPGIESARSELQDNCGVDVLLLQLNSDNYTEDVLQWIDDQKKK